LLTVNWCNVKGHFDIFKGLLVLLVSLGLVFHLA